MSSVADSQSAATAPPVLDGQKRLLFWACFSALVATSFCFVTRGMLINAWGTEFGWTEVQKGGILGAGLWPFAITIILFSLVVDKIGYGRAMFFAFACHLTFAILTIAAPKIGDAKTVYWAFYAGSFAGALAAGTVEAVINPVVATLFPREKVKWLSILHAGWPGGLVLGGIISLLMGEATNWRYKVAIILVPTVFYGIMMIGRKWPVHERVAAGISYRDMLREFGLVCAFIVSFLIWYQVGDTFGFPMWLRWALIGVSVVGYGAAAGVALGRPVFIALVLIMIPLATTELGTDSWVSDLMTPEMGGNAGWVLVYTSFIMMILRFCAGGIVHRLSPLGLLSIAAFLAICGLLFLSKATGVTILVAATVYALGKTFFWPAMLGVASEQFPRGGAMTINGISGIGMIGVGIIGTVFIGYFQDTTVNSRLATKDPAVHQMVAIEKPWVFGKYTAVDPEKVKTQLSPDQQKEIEALSATAKKEALGSVAVFPAIMLVGYLILMGYYKAKGGYKPVVLAEGGGEA